MTLPNSEGICSICFNPVWRGDEYRIFEGGRTFHKKCVERFPECRPIKLDKASAACGSCGVPLGMSQAEFEALPNGGLTVPVDTSRVQTQRDLLMYAGVLTNSFAKINRAGELVFVQLTCTQDDHGMVVPVRELQGNIRFSTEFSDSTARVTAFIMNRNGARLSSRNRITSSGSDCLTLEWTENPLLSGMKDSEVRDVLTTAVSAIYRCINRAYKAEFSGDPALDIGDYVRLRGGQIDTRRGYGTGMITSQTWRYRGKHTIQCNVPSTVAVSAAATAALSDDDDVNRVQPKSQLEKRIDALEKKLAECSSGGGSYVGKVAVTEKLGSISIFRPRVEMVPMYETMTLGTTVEETGG